MCNQFYRQCKECGSSVHLNFKCSCGGDPWFVNEQKKRETVEKLPELSKKEKIRKAIKEDLFDVW